jgi:uncharacterized protein VirK/YbjX
LIKREIRQIFFQSLFKLAGQSFFWSPRRLLRLIWTISRNIPLQLRVLRLLTRHEYRRLAEAEPTFPVKFLARDYLVCGLTIDQHAACFLHHYKRLPHGLPREWLSKALHQDITVYRLFEAGRVFTVKLGLSRPWDREGEMSLTLEMDAQPLFVLSFTIVPGRVVGSKLDELLLVSRLQGVKGRFDEIRLATKTLHDVAPPAVLMAALCGFAEKYKIEGLAGASSSMKPEVDSVTDGRPLDFQAYDQFFEGIGAARGLAGFYLAPIPLPEKPMTMVKKGHKTRTREKRSYKREVSDAVLFWFEGLQKDTVPQAEGTPAAALYMHHPLQRPNPLG